MIRIFAKEDFLWYNFSIKGDFTVINSLFEQFRGIYSTRRLSSVKLKTLPAKKKSVTSKCGDNVD